MAIIIGITGAKRSGKNTVARMIEDWLTQNRPNVPSFRHAFARPVVERGCEIFGLSSDHWEDLKEAYVEVTLPGGTQFTTNGRHIVREVGMVMTEVDPMHLVDEVDEEVSLLSETRYRSVHLITDLRRDIEREWLINRLEFDGDEIHLLQIVGDRGANSDSHVTERGVAPILGETTKITNSSDTSLDDLREHIDKWCVSVLNNLIEEA